MSLRVMLLTVGMVCAAQASTATDLAAKVSVHAETALSTLPEITHGVNTAAWDGELLDPAVPSLLRAAGVNTLRFPGGSIADDYHWKTHTAGRGQFLSPAANFDGFMNVAAQCGARAIITVNYGTDPTGTTGGDPAEAAEWVDYANRVKHYGVKYWEIGNELYGNGQYQTKWEADLHADHSPIAYGQNVVKFAAAMKAKDPGIKIGAVLTAPGQWPDELTPRWNETVLAQCGGVIDFVSVHWYPQVSGKEDDAFLLDTPPTQIPAMMSTLRAVIARFCGANSSRVQIFVTETNSVPIHPGKQLTGLVNSLFLADNFATWLENGAANVLWWDLHNGVETAGNNSQSLDGSAAFGDYGMLANGQPPGPARNAPYPSYYGMQMIGMFARPGGTALHVVCSQTLLAAHAVRQENGDVALLLLNKDPANRYDAEISVSGFTLGTVAKAYFYGQTSGTGGISSGDTAAAANFSRVLPPYSLTTIILQPAR